MVWTLGHGSRLARAGVGGWVQGRHDGRLIAKAWRIGAGLGEGGAGQVRSGVRKAPEPDHLLDRLQRRAFARLPLPGGEQNQG